METKRTRQLLLLLILCSVLFSQAAAWLPLGDPSAVGNAKHADAVFTSDYSSLLGQMYFKEYLESHIGKWVGNDVLEDQGPVKRQSDAVFTDQYTRLLKQIAVKKYLKSLLNGSSSKPNEEESQDQ